MGARACSCVLRCLACYICRRSTKHLRISATCNYGNVRSGLINPPDIHVVLNYNVTDSVVSCCPAPHAPGGHDRRRKISTNATSHHARISVPPSGGTKEWYAESTMWEFLLGGRIFSDGNTLMASDHLGNNMSDFPTPDWARSLTKRHARGAVLSSLMGLPNPTWGSLTCCFPSGTWTDKSSCYLVISRLNRPTHPHAHDPTHATIVRLRITQT